jgi:hypothetical protein
VDIGDLEMRTKLKVEQCGGLGYVDMKQAFYGTVKSGALRFELPRWVDSLIVCRVNDGSQCELVRDLMFHVGGKPVTNRSVVNTHGAMYLGTPICAAMSVKRSSSAVELVMRVINPTSICSLSHIVAL